jgi:hypothetical protein
LRVRIPPRPPPHFPQNTRLFASLGLFNRSCTLILDSARKCTILHLSARKRWTLRWTQIAPRFRNRCDIALGLRQRGQTRHRPAEVVKIQMRIPRHHGRRQRCESCHFKESTSCGFSGAQPPKALALDSSGRRSVASSNRTNSSGMITRLSCRTSAFTFIIGTPWNGFVARRDPRTSQLPKHTAAVAYALRVRALKPSVTRPFSQRSSLARFRILRSGHPHFSALVQRYRQIGRASPFPHGHNPPALDENIALNSGTDMHIVLPGREEAG